LHLTEPYQRAISSSLAIVEERLFELERLLKNEHGVSIFNSVRSTLGPEQKQHIQREIEDIREGLWDIKSTLSLKSSSVNDAVLIGSRCASIWEMLCNLETKRLRRYGAPPEELGNYFDTKIRELIKHIERISELVEKKK